MLLFFTLFRGGLVRCSKTKPAPLY